MSRCLVGRIVVGLAVATTWRLVDAQCTEFGSNEHMIDTATNNITISCTSGGNATDVADATMDGDVCAVACELATQRFAAAAQSTTWTCNATAMTWTIAGELPTTCVDACGLAEASMYSAACCTGISPETCAEGFGGCAASSECTGELVCGAAGSSCSAEFETAAGGNVTTRCCVNPPPPPPAPAAAECSAESLSAETPYSADCCVNSMAGTCDAFFGGCSSDCHCSGILECGAAGSSCSAEFRDAAVAAGAARADLRCCQFPVACSTTGQTAGHNYFTANGRPSGCPQAMSDLPGNWESADCTAECAAGLQTAIDALNGADACCNFRWYLDGFAGIGPDHLDYADMAVRNLREICNITIIDEESCTPGVTAEPCVDEVDTAECFMMSKAFFNSSDDLIVHYDGNTSVCPPGMPGNWVECPTDCAAGMQAAVNELGCCLREYLNDFVNPNGDTGMYADMAFDNVLAICDLDLPESECFGDVCNARAKNFFNTSNDRIVHLSTGEAGETDVCPMGLPGMWTECPMACATGIQAAIDTLDCCLQEYLDEFAGPGDHGMYSDMAFSNVMRLCDLNLPNSACFAEFTMPTTEPGPSGATHLSTSVVVVSMLSLAVAALLTN